jgi:hypothetical protein
VTEHDSTTGRPARLLPPPQGGVGLTSRLSVATDPPVRCLSQWCEADDPATEVWRFVALGVSLARYGLLHPRIIGDPSRTGRYDQQALKRVWHYVARFDSPEMRALTRS